LLSPLLTGFVRKVKARLLRRQGPPLLQPYRDLVRLLRKEVVLADSASWLFRVIPYIVFAGTWVAASLVPTFRSGLLFSWSADLGLRVSLGLVLLALIVVAVAEHPRIPIDIAAAHLDLTMVHEAMVLEYSRRHLALIDLSSELKLLLYVSVIGCRFTP